VLLVLAPTTITTDEILYLGEVGDALVLRHDDGERVGRGNEEARAHDHVPEKKEKSCLEQPRLKKLHYEQTRSKLTNPVENPAKLDRVC